MATVPPQLQPLPGGGGVVLLSTPGSPVKNCPPGVRSIDVTRIGTHYTHDWLFGGGSRPYRLPMFGPVTTLRNIFCALFTGLPRIFRPLFTGLGVLVCYCWGEKGAFAPRASRW